MITLSDQEASFKKLIYIWNYLIIMNYYKIFAKFDIKSALKLLFLNLLQYPKNSFTQLWAKQSFRFVGISLNTDGVNKIHICKIRDIFLLFVLLLLILPIDN